MTSCAKPISQAALLASALEGFAPAPGYPPAQASPQAKNLPELFARLAQSLEKGLSGMGPESARLRSQALSQRSLNFAARNLAKGQVGRYVSWFGAGDWAPILEAPRAGDQGCILLLVWRCLMNEQNWPRAKEVLAHWERALGALRGAEPKIKGQWMFWKHMPWTSNVHPEENVWSLQEMALAADNPLGLAWMEENGFEPLGSEQLDLSAKKKIAAMGIANNDPSALEVLERMRSFQETQEMVRFARAGFASSKGSACLRV